MVSQRVLCRKFIGRVAELEYLATCRRGAGDSRGGGIIVLGEAGIGKSRLVQEYRERYCARSLVAVGTCREFGQRPFDPLTDILARLDGEPASRLAASSSKEEQVAAIIATVERAASRRLTTIVVEDVHWAQIELLQMLATLSQWATHRRLLVIMTCRDAEVPPTSPKFKALARLSRETSMLRLEPFGSAELSDLMVGALGDLEAIVPAATFNAVRRRSAGNPLFAEELLRHAVDERRGHDPRPAPHALPLSLQGVIRERLDRCDARDREFLSGASVFGQRFRIDLLTKVFGLERDEVASALARLIELQLIDRCDDPLAYEFRHALARDVVYGDLVPSEAHALHLRIAETVESSTDAPAHAELLAHSFWEAGLPDRAAPYCEAAGDDAEKHYAYEDAVLWFERAADAYGDRAADLGRVLKKASAALNRLSEPKRAVPLYQRAIAVLAASGDFDTAVRMSTYLGATLYNDLRETEALEAYEAAFDLAVRSGIAELQEHVRIRQFSMLVAKRDVPSALERLASVDEGTLDPTSRDTFEFHIAKARLHGLCDEPELRRACIASAFATLERRGNPLNEVRFARGTIAVDSLALGDMEEARRHAESGLAVARQIRADVPYMLSLLAEIEERVGDFRKARDYLAAVALVPELLTRHVRTIAAIRVALATGDDDFLRDALDLELLREAERGGHKNVALQLTCAFAAALDRLDRRDEALELGERALSAIDSPFNLAWEIIALAELMPARVARLRGVVTCVPTARLGPLNAALLAMLDAIAAREAGSVEACTAFAHDGARRFAGIGWPMPQARCLELAGDRAGALLMYRRLGCAADVRRTERTASNGGAAVLSPRERELANLIAEGKNNREAALALSVTVKAVEKYLTSIYQKLGVTSRTQLAAYVISARPQAALNQHAD